MNVSDLSLNDVNIALANYLIKQLESIYLYPSMLVVGLYQTHWKKIKKLESITLVSITSVSWVRLVSGKPIKTKRNNYVSKLR